MTRRNEPESTWPAALGMQELSNGVISLSDIDSPTLQLGITYWRDLCGDRKFPSRADVTPRGLGQLLRNTMLLRVIEGGKDFEYRIVGDAYAVAHGFSFQGLRLTQIREISAEYTDMVRPVYDFVVRDAEPVAVRGWVARGGLKTESIYAECVYLPLGPNEKTVDHILAFSVYVPRERLAKPV